MPAVATPLHIDPPCFWGLVILLVFAVGVSAYCAYLNSADKR